MRYDADIHYKFYLPILEAQIRHDIEYIVKADFYSKVAVTWGHNSNEKCSMEKEIVYLRAIVQSHSYYLKLL